MSRFRQLASFQGSEVVMTYAEQLHADHKSRIRRLYGPPKPKIIIVDQIKKPVEVPKKTFTINAIGDDEYMAMMADSSPPNPVPSCFLMKAILREVAKKHSLTREQITSRRVQRPLVLARHEFCYRAFTETKASLPQIGRMIERDHTTVIHAIAAHCERNGLTFPKGAVWQSFTKRRDQQRANSRRHYWKMLHEGNPE